MPARKVYPDKPCPACGKLLVHPQKYCSVTHQQLALRNQRIASWLAGDNDAKGDKAGRIAPWAREYLISVRGEACERCGWCERHPRTGKVPLEFDHIDGNRKNNRPENFCLLCPNCHALTATWGYTGSTGS